MERGDGVLEDGEEAEMRLRVTVVPSAFFREEGRLNFGVVEPKADVCVEERVEPEGESGGTALPRIWSLLVSDSRR